MPAPRTACCCGCASELLAHEEGGLALQREVDATALCRGPSRSVSTRAGKQPLLLFFDATALCRGRSRSSSTGHGKRVRPSFPLFFGCHGPGAVEESRSSS